MSTTATTQLASAASFVVLGASAVTNSDGASTTFNGGSIGSYPTNTVSPGSPTPWTLTGGAAVVTASAANNTDLANAIVYYQGLTGATTLAASYATHTFLATATGVAGGPGFLGNVATTLLFSGGTITLDGAGLTNPVFVFQVGSALNITTAATTFTLINGATADRVIFVVGTTATFDAHDHVFVGNILAHTSIVLNATSLTTFNGRALAATGAVTITNPVAFTVIVGIPVFGAGAVLSIVAGSVIRSISQRYEEHIGLLTISAGVYPTGGFSLDALFTTILQPSSPYIIWVELHSVTGSGYIYQRTNVAAGSPPTTGNLKILVIGAAGSPAFLADSLVELQANSIPSGVAGDTIAFRVCYNRNIGAWVNYTNPY